MLVNQIEVLETEWLDSKEAKGEKFRRVISQLDLVNKYLGNEQHIVRVFKKLLAKSDIEKGSVVRVVDLGCGSGYILKKMADLILELGYLPYLIGIDSNQEALSFAGEKLSHYDYELHCKEINENYKIPETNFLISSHFLYHLKPTQIQDFLTLNKNGVKHSIVFSELRKSKISEVLFPFFTRILNFEKEVLEDGIKALRCTPNHQTFIDTYSRFNKVKVQKKWFYRTLIYGEL